MTPQTLAAIKTAQTRQKVIYEAAVIDCKLYDIVPDIHHQNPCTDCSLSKRCGSMDYGHMAKLQRDALGYTCDIAKVHFVLRPSPSTLRYGDL